MHRPEVDQLCHTVAGAAPHARLPHAKRPRRTFDAELSALANFEATYADELVWLRKMTSLPAEAASLLAVRRAASQIDPRLLTTQSARDLHQRLAAHVQSQASLTGLARDLGIVGETSSLSDVTAACLLDVWPLSLAIGKLLVSGGDDRLDLDPESGVNRYGCAPHPRTDVLSFGSCTASSLTPQAFAAAEHGRRAMIIAALQGNYASAVRAACSHLERAVLDAFQVSDLADAVLTASGTDAALVVTALLASEHPHLELTSLVVSPSETGSGVPLAVQGCHFADTSPSGQTVCKGTPLSGMLRHPHLVAIELRDSTGHPFPDEDVVRACDTAIRGAVRRGRVVLHAIDGSKTGLTAPPRRSLFDLAEKYGKDLDIVVDACQARLEPALIRAYLQRGFTVLVTGSKFFSAPGFCGAVLFPRARLGRILANSALPAGLAAYLGSGDGFGSRLCPGLLLRWTAALHEMVRFGAVPDAEIGRRLERLTTDVHSVLRTDERLCLVPAPRPEGAGWSSRRSVFTFTVRSGQSLLRADELRAIYLALQDDLSNSQAGCIDPVLASTRCQIGQPVQLGSPQLGGLRIAVSAPQITEDTDHSHSLTCIVAKLRLLLMDGILHKSAIAVKSGAAA